MTRGRWLRKIAAMGGALTIGAGCARILGFGELEFAAEGDEGGATPSEAAVPPSDGQAPDAAFRCSELPAPIDSGAGAARQLPTGTTCGSPDPLRFCDGFERCVVGHLNDGKPMWWELAGLSPPNGERSTVGVRVHEDRSTPGNYMYATVPPSGRSARISARNAIAPTQLALVTFRMRLHYGSETPVVELVLGNKGSVALQVGALGELSLLELSLSAPDPYRQ